MESSDEPERATASRDGVFDGRRSGAGEADRHHARSQDFARDAEPDHESAERERLRLPHLREVLRAELPVHQERADVGGVPFRSESDHDRDYRDASGLDRSGGGDRTGPVLALAHQASEFHAANPGQSRLPASALRARRNGAALSRTAGLGAGRLPVQRQIVPRQRADDDAVRSGESEGDHRGARRSRLRLRLRRQPGGPAPFRDRGRGSGRRFPALPDHGRGSDPGRRTAKSGKRELLPIAMFSSALGSDSAARWRWTSARRELCAPPKTRAEPGHRAAPANQGRKLYESENRKLPCLGGIRRHGDIAVACLCSGRQCAPVLDALYAGAGSARRRLQGQDRPDREHRGRRSGRIREPHHPRLHRKDRRHRRRPYAGDPGSALGAGRLAPPDHGRRQGDGQQGRYPGRPARRLSRQRRLLGAAVLRRDRYDELPQGHPLRRRLRPAAGNLGRRPESRQGREQR